MKKKTLIATALATCFTLSATLTGCSLVSVISKADMEQVIATVDIKESDKFKASSLAKYETALNKTSIDKRSLVSYFLNVGYSYISQDTSYEDTFNMLLDALIDNAVLVQYSTAALLDDKATNKDSVLGYEESALSVYNGKAGNVAKYEYLLGGEDSEDVKLAKYKLYSSINSAIDNYEHADAVDDGEYSGTATRTTPKNLKTEQDDYYPKTVDGKLDYNVYTGYEGYLLKDSGAYKDDAAEGTTIATRVKAYNTFIESLRKNDLIDVKAEAGKLKDITKLEYYTNEYEAQLESRIINRYNDIYETKQGEVLLEGNYIQKVYEDLVIDQTDKYDSTSAFESAMGSMSSTSFILYSPDTSDSDKFDGERYGKYGFVYNILLPFDAKQSVKLSALSSIKGEDDDNDTYYYERNKILKDIKTEDQRSAWFNGTENYSFKASEAGIDAYGASDYLFFKDNLTNSEEGGRYKKLEIYDGRYSYNGQVFENDDGSYTLIGNELDIDGMLEEFKAYIDYVLGGKKVSYDITKNYYDTKTFTKEDDEDEIDFSKFLYASGKVDFGTFNRNDLLNASTAQYKAMSAVNELQFAYTTDTSVLSQYVGYSVQAYDTSYIKEFEYAAKLAIANGAGSFTVCAGDYGWHLIYATCTFDGGETYVPDWNNVKKEGTFENLFYEWLKDKNLSNVYTTHRSKILNDLKQEESDSNKDNVTVVKFEKKYKDLLELDKK